MANKKKMTMVEQYNAIKALLNGETVEDYTVEQAVEFINGRVAQVEKKNSTPTGERKPTKTQLENEGIKEQILSIMAENGNPMTVGELMKELGIESNQKVTALLTQLVRTNAVLRTEDKGRPYYALPTEA